MSPLPAYILAGGRSSRFGSNKSRALLDGQPLIQRIAHAAAARCAPVIAVGHHPDEYLDLGLRTIPDHLPGRGPLAGLHAALLDRTDPRWLLLLSCDLLTLDPHWIDALLRARAPHSTAVAFHLDQRWQPLLALYHTSILPRVAAQLKSDEHSLQRLLHTLDCTPATFPPDGPPLRQANRPDDLPAPPDSSCPPARG